MIDKQKDLEEQLALLLIRWEELCEQGKQPSAESLCEDQPELAGPLAKRIEQLNLMDAMLRRSPDENLGPPAAQDRGMGANESAGRLTTAHSATQTPGDVSAVSSLCERELTTQTTYELGPFIAAGGRAQVHIGHDRQLGRDVAVKLLRENIAGDATARNRLQREAEITGTLVHHGVLPVFGIGNRADGSPFYCMRLVAGKTMREAISDLHAAKSAMPVSQQPLAFSQLLRNFVDVCNTVAYAHSRGVIHRDLKPENILIGKFGETFVVDWGLARRLTNDGEQTVVDTEIALDENERFTQIGSVIGTPAYMSPEQASGNPIGVGTESDLFNLGATLYQILTGIAPYHGVRISDVVSMAEQCEFKRPRDISPTPAALEAICLKAMSPSPSDRYETATQLATDVERWLTGETVSCYRDHLGVRLMRWGRRHRTLAASLLVLMTTAFFALIVTAVLVGHQRAKAEANFARARQAVDDSFTKVSQHRLLNVSGMHSLRTELLEETLDYYREFANQEQSNSSLSFELARTAMRLGEMNFAVGDLDKAQKHLKEADHLFTKLRDRIKHDPQVQLFALRTARLRVQCATASSAPETSQSIERALRMLDHLSENVAGRPETQLESAEILLLSSPVDLTVDLGKSQQLADRAQHILMSMPTSEDQAIKNAKRYFSRSACRRKPPSRSD